MTRTSFVLAILLAMLATAVFAQSYQIGSIQVDRPWIRSTPKGAKTAAAYFRITNSGKTADRLIGGSSAIAAEFTLHEMSIDDGVMKMRPLPMGVELKPGETVELKPGSFHGMFVGLKQALKQGEYVKGVLRFERAGSVEIEYSVESIGAQRPASSGAAPEDKLIDPLIAVRAIHFASTVMVSGLIIFALVIADPALRKTGSPSPSPFRRRMTWIFYVNLAIAGASGIVWFLLLAVAIAGRPLSEVLADNTGWVVLTETQFGCAWQLRLLIAVLLAGQFPLLHSPKGPNASWHAYVAVAFSVLFLGGLAWTGHGGATPGGQGYVHLTADFLHLVTAGAWLGGLIPLLLLLMLLKKANDHNSAAAIYHVTRRFSDYGIAAVAVLLATGLINTWYLVGNVYALTSSDYGQLLLMKIGLFGAMVAIAAINRQFLLPRLSKVRESASSVDTFRRLQQNIIAEICLGLAVIAIVGALGNMVPGAHFGLHNH